MTPTQSILAASIRQQEVTDSDGRRLKLRTLTALDTLRLLKAAGPILAQNQPWISMATLVFCVTEIDGIPTPAPANEAQIEALVERLGESGLSAIADALDAQQDAEAGTATAGNSLGTPT